MEVAKGSRRPKSLMITNSAALQNFYMALETESPVTPDVYKLVTGINKSGTQDPLIRSAVMPRQPFVNLFREWKENKLLNLADLRLKAIVLLAFTAMLRPSDIAPRSVTLQEEELKLNEFTRDNVMFQPDGTLCMYLHGIKNDYARDGFRVIINPMDEEKLCPVQTLYDYMERTKCLTNDKGPVFLTMKRPIKAMSTQSVAQVLVKSIKLVGLEGRGFSAKNFRPTGATAAIENGLEPEEVRATGRWKDKETFDKHYVHARPNINFTRRLLLGTDS